ncbi:MAG: DUF2267 domain-containing protein [Vicinamibacterales bacterium]
MPYPAEYQRATDAFAAFLLEVRDRCDFASPNQAYTTAQAVLQVFRRRLPLADAIRFAGVLPVGLRALFVADWDPGEPQRPFGSLADMTAEVRALRPGHNFSPPHAIAAVAGALRAHVDVARLDALLATLPRDAGRFWAI